MNIAQFIIRKNQTVFRIEFKKHLIIATIKKKKRKEDMSSRGSEMPQAVEFLYKGAEWEFIDSISLVYVHFSTCHPMIPLTLSRATINVRFHPRSKIWVSARRVEISTHGSLLLPLLIIFRCSSSSSFSSIARTSLLSHFSDDTASRSVVLAFSCYFDVNMVEGLISGVFMRLPICIKLK